MIINQLNSEIRGDGLIDIDFQAVTNDIKDVVRLSHLMNIDISTDGFCSGCGDGGCEEYREPIYGGAYYDEDGDLIYIKKVIYNKPVIIIMWSDGTKTRSTCSKEDIWNPELGLSLGVLKKTMGQEFVNKLFRDWAVEASTFDMMEGESPVKVLTLKEVRKNAKDTKDASEFLDKIQQK